MSGRQNHCRTLNQSIAQPDPSNLLITDLHTAHLSLEDDLSTCRHDAFAHSRNNTGQPIGTDMRVRIVKNRLICTMKSKHFKSPTVISPLFGTGKELAIRVGSSTTLAKSIIGIGINSAITVDLRNIPFAGRDITSTLQHNRFDSQLNQSQRCKQAGRSRPHHDHRSPTTNIGIVEPNFRRSLLSIDINFKSQIDLDRTPTGIDRTTYNPQQGYSCRINM